MTIISVIVVGRMIEIYIHMAIAPLPIATLPNSEVNGVAKNFFKSFFALSIQGVIIYIVVAIFPMLFGATALSQDGSDFSTSLMNAAAYSFVLLMAVFTSGKVAKSICSAM
jgi:hypothetical protein